MKISPTSKKSRRLLPIFISHSGWGYYISTGILCTIIGCSSTSKEEAVAVYESEIKELQRIKAATAFITITANIEMSKCENIIENCQTEIQEYKEFIRDSPMDRKSYLAVQTEIEKLNIQWVECKNQFKIIKKQTELQIKKLEFQIRVQEEHVQKARKARNLALGY